MTTHYYETQEVTLTALLVEGQAESGTVTFTFYVDGEQHGEPVEKQLEESASSVSCDFTCPEVPADQESYALACKAEADQELIRRFDDMRAWPRKVKVTTVDAVSGDPVTGVKLRVMQNQQQVGPTARTFGQDGSAELGLNRGHPFTVEVRPPYQLHPPIAGDTLRDLTARVGLDFTAEFVAPVRPQNGRIKQLANLATANAGRDGKGHQVTLEVGVAGDRNGANNPTIGDLRVKIYLKVVFGPAPGKSRRNAPKTQLVQENHLQGWTEVTAGEEYTATVTTNIVDGTQEFTVELGMAGGDTCTVSIGHDDTCGDASVTFTNWRRLYYEILAPDFMTLDNCQLPDGTPGKDLPQAMRDEVKTLADSIFLELVVIKSHLFAANLNGYPGIVPRSFLERQGGPGQVYCLDLYSIVNLPRAFDQGQDPLSFYLHLCDGYYKNLTALGEPAVTYATTATTRQPEVQLAGHRWWPLLLGPPIPPENTAIHAVTWQAAVPAGTYTRQPVLHFAGTVHQPDPRTSIRTKYVQIQETVQGVNLDVTFTTTFGTVRTDLSENQQTAIDNFMRQVSIPGTQQLSFRLVGETDSDRRRERMTAVHNGLTDAHTRLEICTLDLHPGCDPNNGGQPRQGNANVLAWVDVGRSTPSKIALTLPNAQATDPGSFVGAAATATRCPVTITWRVAKMMPINGTSFGRDKPQIVQQGLGGRVVCIMDPDNPRAVANTLLHEIAHQLNMTVYDGDHAPGIARSKRIDEQETHVAYQHNGQLGHVYVAHDHQGPHCAWGLSDLQKASDHYDPHAANATCTMFGTGKPRDNEMTAQGFCVQCKDYLKARNVADLGDPTVIP